MMKSKPLALVLFLISFVSFFWTFFVHQNDFNIPIYGRLNSDIRINIETKTPNKITVYAGSAKIPPYIMKTKNSYVSFAVDNYPIKILSFKNDGDIDNIALTAGNRLFYYTKDEILNFEKTSDGRYIFPSEIKYYKNSNYITDMGGLRRISIYFLSIFYNMKFYIFPLLTLLSGAILYPGLEISIWWIFILGIAVRLAGNDFPFWTDELYTATVAGNPALPFSAVFKDPGNPPLFFILAKYWGAVFKQNEALLRVLPCIFSSLTILAVYFFVKKYISKTPALFCSFLCAFNVYLIHTGREFRSYSLCCLLSLITGFYLLKIIEEKKNKDFIIYGILAALMLNTHYFQALILFGNFILGMVFLDNKSRLKFFVANLTGGIFFLPFFIMTALNCALMDTNFNVLPFYTFPQISKLWAQYFSNPLLAICVLFLAVFVFIKRKKFEKGFLKLYFYSLYPVFFLFASSWLLSFVRPVIREYYFVVILPFIMIFIGMSAFIFKKPVMALFIFILFFNFGQYFGKERTILIRFQNIIEYAKADTKEGLKTAVALHDYPDYALFYNNPFDIIMYKFLTPPDRMAEIFKNSDADIIYARLEYNKFPLFVQKFSEFADVSIIRTDKDVLVARILKKGKYVR